jgi:hypothetical protein
VAPTFRQSSIDETPDLSDPAHEGSFSMGEKCNRSQREAAIEEFWPESYLPLNC